MNETHANELAWTWYRNFRLAGLNAWTALDGCHRIATAGGDKTVQQFERADRMDGLDKLITTSARVPLPHFMMEDTYP